MQAARSVHNAMQIERPEGEGVHASEPNLVRLLSVVLYAAKLLAVTCFTCEVVVDGEEET